MGSSQRRSLAESSSASDPTAPYAQGARTPATHRRGICPGRCPSWGQSAAQTAADWPPSGGVERPRRKVRFARLIQRRVRAFWPAFGLRRLRRQSQPACSPLRVSAMVTGWRDPSDVEPDASHPGESACRRGRGICFPAQSADAHHTWHGDRPSPQGRGCTPPSWSPSASTKRRRICS